MRKVIRGGTIVTASDTVQADVLIDGDVIAAIGNYADVDAESIDATGCYVLPGLIDNHTHLSMPFGGTWTNDDYDTGTQAAAAGGVTCVVDFALQMHPGGLRSSLEEWQGRAEGAAHVDYGFHMAITKADEGTFADMQAMVDEGVSTFKVFLAYRGALMVTDDLFLATLERTTETGGLVMVHAENGDGIDYLVRKALAAGNTDPIYHAYTRPEEFEAEATGRAIRLAEYAGRRSTSSTCPASGPRRSSSTPAPGASRPTARPASSTCSPTSTTSSGPTSRAPATSARRRCATRPTSRSCGTRWCTTTCSPSRPTTAPSRTSRSAWATATSRRSPTASQRSSTGCRCCGSTGARGPDVDEPPRRGDVDGDREDLRPVPAQGLDRPRADADLVIFDPNRQFTFGTDTSLMNVDYDLWAGKTVAGSPRTTLSRGTVVYDDGKILTQPGHGRFVKRSTFDPATQGNVRAGTLAAR